MERLSNIEVGRLVDLSHVQVSRIRSGLRLPGVETMIRICQVFDWSMDDQASARTREKYGPEFEEALARYASRRVTATTPEERAPRS